MIRDFRIILSFFVIFVIIIICKRWRKKRLLDKAFLASCPPEFEKIYNELCKTKIPVLEKERKYIVLLYILIALSILLFFFSFMVFNFSLMFIDIVFIVAFMLIFRKKERKYISIYKKEVLNNFIKLIDNNLEYQTENIFSDGIILDYEIANFSNEYFDIYYVDDYISGMLNNEIYTQMSDLHLQRREEYYSDGEKEERIVNVFQGIYSKTECSKDIKTSIKILKNQFKFFNHDTRVEMDSQEFEKYFDIYSDDKILTMRLLTSDVMTTLIDFYNTYNIIYEIVINSSQIHMRFFTGPMFEPKIFRNSMDKKLLLEYFYILKFVVDVTKEINAALNEIEL